MAKCSLIIFHILLNHCLMVGDIYVSCLYFMRHWQNKSWPGEGTNFSCRNSYKVVMYSYCLMYITLQTVPVKEKFIMAIVKDGKKDFI